MTTAQLWAVQEDDERPGIIKQYANAILAGDISDTLKLIKEASKMDKPEAEKDIESKSIQELAIGEDDEAFYVALISENTNQLLRKNISPQETARLTQNLDIFRTKLREIRSRRPKEGTTLAKVLEAAKSVPVKAKTVKKPKSTHVKKKTTARKPAGAMQKKKTGTNTLKAVK